MAAFSRRYEAALSLAAHAHQTQVRKGSDTPYITHPVHVSVILLRYGFAEDVIVAGLLHDVVEDQNVPLASIQSQFGPAVAEMVAALSERKREGETKRPWRIRKEEALEQLGRATSDAAAVKAADVLHNAHSLAAHLCARGPSAWSEYSRGPEETMWYYHSALAIVRRQLGAHPLVTETEQAIQELEGVIAATADA